MSQPTFERRFHDIVAQLRRTSGLHALCCLALALVAGLGLLALADYWLEIRWAVRAAGLGLVGTAGAAWGVTRLWRSLRYWNQPRAAARIEEQFSDLGQVVRTSIQFRNGGEPSASGASATLVRALAQQVEDQTCHLSLEDAVPRSQLRRATACLAVTAVLTLLACAASWQWRTATTRALLADAPYTTIDVEPGDTRVDELQSLTLTAVVSGRTNRPVTLLKRPLGDEQSLWAEQLLLPDEVVERSSRLVRYQTEIPAIAEPFEYKIKAGRIATRTHRVDVQYPIAIRAIQADVTPPAYTGVEQYSVESGNFSAPAESTAQLRIELDRPVQRGWLELHPSGRSRNADQATTRHECTTQGSLLTTELQLGEDQSYTVWAEGPDAPQMRPNRYRIRVRQDRPPRLNFESPHEWTEVTPLAEVLIRLRAGDDYGITKAGIVVQINNEEEFTLATWPDDESAAAEAAANEQRGTILERLLPLEYFELTQLDSISFYAFADDNLPGGGQRYETDLHFIDIRPFLVRYPRPADSLSAAGGGGGSGPRFAALQELIGRQRFILNRTLRLARKADRNQPINIDRLDELVQFESNTAELTGQLAVETARIEDRIDIDEDRISDLFFVAEEQMLAAVDSMSVGKYRNAVLQEKDAVRYLIEARNRIDQLSMGGNRRVALELYRLSRLMRQRLRPRRSDQERGDDIARELRALAQKQNGIGSLLAELDRATTAAGGEQQDDAAASETGAPAVEMLSRDLEDQQARLTIDVEEVERMLGGLQRTTELVRDRMDDAVQRTIAINESIQSRSFGEAIPLAERASQEFRQLADNVIGVSRREAAQRIAISRDLATRISYAERELAGAISELAGLAGNDRLPAADRDTGEERAEAVEALGWDAEALTESGRSVVDILQAMLDAFETRQAPAVERAGRLLEQLKLDEIVEAMAAETNLISSGQWGQAHVQALDAADRFDIAAQQLDAIYRDVVAPLVQRLRALETRAAELLQRLDRLESEDHISRWHRRAGALLDDLQEGEFAAQQASELGEAMQTAGWEEAGRSRWNWTRRDDGRFAAPADYAAAMQGVLQGIRAHLQELRLANYSDQATEPVPPKYRDLVDRYIEVLSRRAGD